MKLSELQAALEQQFDALVENKGSNKFSQATYNIEDCSVEVIVSMQRERIELGVKDNICLDNKFCVDKASVLIKPDNEKVKSVATAYLSKKIEIFDEMRRQFDEVKINGIKI